MEKPQIILHIQKAVNYTLFDVKWIPNSAKFVSLGNYARGSGALQIYEVCRGEVNCITDVEKSKPFKCCTFGASSVRNQHLATGDFDGKLCIWNLESLGLPLYSVKGHTEIINSIDAIGGLGIGEGAPEIVTGSRDGTVKVWDPRQKNEAVATMLPEEGETRRDCWTVCFAFRFWSKECEALMLSEDDSKGHAYNAHDRCVAAGYDNGDVKLFDLRAMKLRWETNINNGVCCVQFDRKDISMNKLVATTLESRFYVWDMRTQHPTKGFSSLSEKVDTAHCSELLYGRRFPLKPKGAVYRSYVRPAILYGSETWCLKAHKSTVWLVRHLPQNRDVFMTTGGSGSLYLWKYDYPSSRTASDSEGKAMGVMGSLNLQQNVTLSTQPISSFDWSPDKEGLAACTSFDQTLRLIIVTKLKTV